MPSDTPEYVAGWSFTNACNLQCKHCYNASGKRRPDELTLEAAMQVADKLAAAGTTAVNFGGGECCLRPDFIPLCQYLRGKGMKISYTTNGTLFEKIEPYLDLFHDVGVSIDFPDAARHDDFRGLPGTYEKAIATLRQLVERKVHNELVTCITKQNYRDLPGLHALAKSLNVDYWRLNRFRANGRGIVNEEELALSQEDLREAYAYLARFMRKNAPVPEPLFRAAFGGSYIMEGDPSGFSAFRIQPTGEVSPSVFLAESGGNITHAGLEEIMHSPVFEAIRDRTPVGKCAACPAYGHCKGGDAGASFLAYGHFNGPDPLCWLTPAEALPSHQSVAQTGNVHEKYLCTVYVPISNRGTRIIERVARTNTAHIRRVTAMLKKEGGQHGQPTTQA